MEKTQKTKELLKPINKEIVIYLNKQPLTKERQEIALFNAVKTIDNMLGLYMINSEQAETMKRQVEYFIFHVYKPNKEQ